MSRGTPDLFRSEPRAYRNGTRHIRQPSTRGSARQERVQAQLAIELAARDAQLACSAGHVPSAAAEGARVDFAFHFADGADSCRGPLLLHRLGLASETLETGR